jgi:polyhydroxyalkanoate synthase
MLKRAWNLATLPRRKRPEVGATPADVVHEENKWRLLRYRPREQGLAFKTPVLLVPSLINRWYVLDLMPGKSFVEYLVGQGHDVFCLDWGVPGPEDRFLGFDDIADRYLRHALSATTRWSGSDQAHVLGYCMGGTLTSIHASVRPERIASLTQLAAPVQFADAGMLAEWTQTDTFDVDALIRGSGLVPWQLMQAAFQMLRPTLNLSKGAHLLHKAWDDRFLDGFLALETWGNDNVSLPGEFYRRYIQELYRGDALVRGRFALSGHPARLENIRCPVLVVSFEHDSIVPSTSASAILDHVRSEDTTHWRLPGGHVGAVVSRAAAQGLWPQLSAWWAERDGADQRSGRSPQPARKATRARASKRVSARAS